MDNGRQTSQSRGVCERATLNAATSPTQLVLNSPGRKPGTSTKVMSGMLNASQNLTKRAPFTDELMSKHPTKRETVCWKL